MIWQKSARIVGSVLALVLCLRAQGQSCFTLPPPTDTAETMRRAFYEYDRTLPLYPELKPLDANKSRQRFRLSYDSVHDQRVTAILAMPKRFSAPFPAVLLLHGAGGNKDVDYIQAASDSLTSQGYATLSMDAQYRGDRSRPNQPGDLRPDSYTLRDAWTQTVTDLRRAIDYLETRSDIDRSKIGFLGLSLGGMQGAVLGGVEERVSCFALGVPGGGFVKTAKNIEKYPALKQRWPISPTPDVMRRVEDIAQVIDPIYFVGHILPRPLFIVVANRDELIPPEMSQALIEASHIRPEDVLRLESGHAIITGIFPIRNFFVKQFGKRTPKTP